MKFPRWDFAKFQSVDARLGSGMQSVGEVMSIGRSWEESFQKALRMVTDFKVDGFGPGDFGDTDDNIERVLREATHRRVYAIARAFELGYTVQKIHEITNIDAFWLNKLKAIQQMQEDLGYLSSIDQMDEYMMRELKEKGFSDRGIARAVGGATEIDVRKMRKEMGVFPVVKQIDTLAAEFPAQ